LRFIACWLELLFGPKVILAPQALKANPKTKKTIPITKNCHIEDLEFLDFILAPTGCC
jgi:hypothetical protein